jgi:hypothetical protein
MALMAATSFTVLASAASAGPGPTTDSAAAAPSALEGASSVLANVNDGLDVEKKMDSALADAIKKSDGPFKVYIAVQDRAAVNDVLAANGLPIINGKEIPGLPTIRSMDLTAKQIRALASSPGTLRVMTYEQPFINEKPLVRSLDEAPVAAPPQVEDYDVDQLHGAVASWAAGYTGSGVKIAVIDTGFDMAHPDLQGQQARYEDPASPYFGWPIAYDDLAAAYWSYDMIGSWVADTSALVPDLGGYIQFDGRTYMVDSLRDVSGNPVTSQSGYYHIGYHTDQNLMDLMGERVGVLVVDASVAGVYDTVYVDILDDYSFDNDKACTKGDEISYFDFYNATSGIQDFSMWNAGDGYADLSGGMVYWISDGMNVLPGSDWLYGASFTPASGDAVAFMGEFSAGQSHGTMTSSAALAQGRTLGGQLSGMAPDAKLICIPFTGDIFNSWLFAEIGADGTFNSGDEANIVSNSYGWSDTAVDAGYEFLDLYAGYISIMGAQTLWCWATGNGGPGYGTLTSVVDFSSVHVGAGTTMQYRYWLGYEPDLAYTKWGDVAPFSNSGPSRQGKLNSEIIASGMYSMEPAPLNEGDYFYTIGDGSMHLQLGSGTSHATPTVAGGAALGFQAYYDSWGSWPIIDYAKAALMASADDMHFDPFKQGAGWLNAYTYTQLMSESSGTETVAWGGGNEPVFTKAALYPGFNYGARYEYSPNFLLPGQYDNTHVMTTMNFDPVNPVVVNVTSQLLIKTGSNRLDFVTANTGSLFVDITGLVPASTQLLKVTMFMPFSEFDPNFDYVSEVGYWLELHDWVDFNHDGLGWNSTSSYELFRYTVDGSDCNYNQVMIKDPIARTHDGLIVRVRPAPGLGAAGVHISLQLDYYELQQFPWVTFRMVGDTNWSTGLDFPLAPSSSASWEVNVSVPIGTPVGSYGAAIYVNDGARSQNVPVVVNVPADDFEFQFGGPSVFDTPYNNDITGVADKGWRYEVGDWRMFWAMPSGLPPSPQASLIATVNWTEMPTDVDMYILGPAPNYGAPTMDPPFGDGLLEMPVVESDEMYMGAGMFGVGSSTGGPKEVLAAQFGQWWTNWGLGPAPFAILTRCPVMSGNASYDTITGFTTWLTVNDYSPRTVYLQLHEPLDPLTGTISAYYDLTTASPVEARGGGVGPYKTSFYPSEPVWQDTLTGNFVQDLANAGYTRYVEVRDSSVLKVSTAEVTNAPDIDLGVWYDENHNGIADLTEPYWYVGISGSTERLTIDHPADGTYIIKVLGYTVTGFPGWFELTVQTGVPGSITATDLESPVASGTHWFNISYSVPAAVGIYEGQATFGFMGASDMFSIDVTIEVIDAGPPEIQNIIPPQDAYWPTDQLTVSFYVNDHVGFYSGVDWSTLSVWLDGKIDMLAVSMWYTSDDNATIMFPYVLTQGLHYVEISVADLYGNWAWNTTSFYIDSRIETFSAYMWDPSTWNMIPQGSTIPLSDIAVDGVTDPYAEVDLIAPTGYYTTTADLSGYYLFDTVALQEGLNVLVVQTTNLAGVQASRTLMVVSDTFCMLMVLEPDTPTANAMLELVGLTEPGAIVTLNDLPATVNADGSWSGDVTLVEGLNEIWVNATDLVGNTAQAVVEVVLDTTPPALTVSGPADGSNTSEPSVTVFGTTEAGATVSVNGVLASNGTANWSATVVLSEGWNTITVVATDALGNSASMTITVEYIPPVYVTPEELAAVQAELQNALDNLSAELAENVSALQAEIAALQAALGENVSDLQAQIDALSAQLAADVAELNALIDQLDAGLMENVSALNADIAAIQAQIAALDSALTQNITALQSQITQTRNDMTALNNTLQGDLTDLQNNLENQLNQLNQTTQNDINTVDEKAKDTNAFASMLMYLTLALFAIALILIGIAWYVMNGRIGGRGGSGGAGQSMEEVEPEAPSEVEKEFEALEKEIKQDEL